MKTLTALTADQKRTINNEIIRTNLIINKERSYSVEFQNQKYIAKYETVLVKLNDMLVNGWNKPEL